MNEFVDAWMQQARHAAKSTDRYCVLSFMVSEGHLNDYRFKTIMEDVKHFPTSTAQNLTTLQFTADAIALLVHLRAVFAS